MTISLSYRNTLFSRFIKMLILHCIIISPVLAQQHQTIESIVQDENGLPIDDVNICLIDSHNNKAQETQTNEKGMFTLKTNLEFPFIVELSHTAFNKHTIYINNDTQLPLLKDITLTAKVESLPGVEVTSSKQKMFFRNEALVINISDDNRFQTLPLSTVLKRMPGVDIDKNGNVTVYGHLATVYIDGVPQKTLTPEMLKKIIDAHPTNVVEEVEVSNSSTGAYGSAPRSSYINIVTKSSFTDGKLITLGVDGIYYDKNKIAGNVNTGLIYSKGNFNITTMLAYENEYRYRSGSIGTNFSNGDQITQNSMKESRHNTLSGSVNANLKFNDGSMLSAYLNLYDDFARHNQTEEDIVNIEAEENRTKGHKTWRSNDDLWSAYMQYQSNTNCKHSYMASYYYLFGGQRTLDNTFTYENNNSPYLTYDAKMKGGIHGVTAKYSYKPKPQGRELSLRAEYTHGNLKEDVMYDSNHSDINNSFSGYESNLTVDISYLHRLNKNWSTYATLSEEFTKREITSGGRQKITQDFNHFLPYAHIRYTSDNQNYRGTLALYSDVENPQYSYMLEGVKIQDDYNYLVGSSNIKPEYTYGVILSQYFYKEFSLFLQFMRHDNISRRVMRQKGHSTEMAYDNIADGNFYTAYVRAPFQFIGGQLTGSITLQASYKQLKNLRNGYELGDLSHKDYWSGSGKMFVNYEPFTNFGCYADLEYTPSYRSPMEKTSDMTILNCGAYYSLMKDGRLKLRLDINNLLNTDKATIDYLYGNVQRKYDITNRSRSITFGITYSISSGKKQNNYSESPIDTSRFGK